MENPVNAEPSAPTPVTRREGGAWRRLQVAPTGKWTFWRYNWLAKHKIIRALEKASEHAKGDLLDVGCGSRPFASIFSGKVRSYLGTDLAASQYLGETAPDVFSQGEAIPFRDDSFDTVLGLSMLTYMPEPDRVLREAHRVLRPGGVLIMEFTQMAPLHDPPFDYFRFTRFGAAWLLEKTGFAPLAFLPVGGLWARVGLSMIAGLNRINRGWTRVFTEIPVRILYVLLQLGFEVLDRLWSDRDETLAHIVVALKRPDGTQGHG
jgi:SAM-dependent methyltransferase